MDPLVRNVVVLGHMGAFPVQYRLIRKARMKTFTLILSCLTLNAAVVRADDFHLVQTQVQDASAPGVPVESLTVYVLILPEHRPQVFKTFDSKPMEETILNLSRGSRLHYDGNALMTSPPVTQIQALTAYCKKKGISLIVSPTN